VGYISTVLVMHIPSVIHDLIFKTLSTYPVQTQACMKTPTNI